MSTATSRPAVTTRYDFCVSDPDTIDVDDLMTVTVSRLIGAGRTNVVVEVLPRAVVESDRFQAAIEVARTGATVTIEEVR